MYECILNMWIMGKADEEYLNKAVEKGRITEEEKETILSQKVK